MVQLVLNNNKKNLLSSGFAASRRSNSRRNFCAASSSTNKRNVRPYTFFLLVACAIVILLYFQLVITLLLTQQVATAAGNKSSNIRSNAIVDLTTRNTSIPQKFVTVVMPSVVNPQGRTTRLTAITDTWGPKANAIYVVHDLQQYTSSIRAASHATRNKALLYPKPLLIPPNISESMGLDRLIYVLQQLLLQHHDNFQYAFFVNDHTFVIPEHLCYFLSMERRQWQHPSDNRDQNSYNDSFLYAGHAMKESGQDYMFNSGAAGYVLSKSTISQLIDTMVHQRHTCYSNLLQNKLAWFQGNPGLIIAKCLHEALGVEAIDTRDHNNPSSSIRRHLFHAFGLVRMVTGKVDEWYKNKHRLLQFTTTTKTPSRLHQQQPLNQQQQDNSDTSNTVLMEEKLKYLLPFGNNCCSTYSVTFHYVNPDETHALYELRQWIQTQKKEQLLLKQELLEGMVRQRWPSSEESLGFYAHKLPLETTQEWKDFLHVLWDISTLPSTEFRSCWSM